MAELSRKGLEERFAEIEAVRGPGSIDREAYKKRLEFEIEMLGKMGFAGYFLIVWDFIRYAKEQGIPVGPGRGSAAGSLVAYSLRITDLDPIPYNLLFERFLNPERISMPDIDVDFCMDRRDEVLKYVTEKYGQDHVTQIITYGTMLAKGVIRDVGRVLDIPYAEVDKVAKLVPNTLGITLEKAMEQEPKLKELKKDPRMAELIEIALHLEGQVRHASKHAAGVVISQEPLTEYLPLFKTPKDEITTQFDMKGVEKIGLVKFDFLGLRTLTVIDKAVKTINQRLSKAPLEHTERFDISRIPLDDAKTYELLSRGETAGIFQLESSGMRDIVIKMKPQCFEDLIALVALYRPGPLGSGMVDDFIKRKKGATKITYELPALEPILKDTYGVIVYQEQVMQIARTLAGYSLGGADLLRRSMGKKDPEVMAREKVPFLEGRGKAGDQPKEGRGDLRPHGQVRRVRIQQVPQRGLRPRLLPDRVPEGPLSRGIHGRPAHERGPGHGQGGQVYLRSAPDGHQDPAAGREREHVGLYRDGCARPREVEPGQHDRVHSLRPGSGQERGPLRDRGDCRRTTEQRRLSRPSRTSARRSTSAG